MSVNKISFVMYSDYKQHFELLSAEETRDLLLAIFDYHSTQVIPQLSPAAQMAFSFIKTTMDRDTRKYQRVIDRNRKNGAKGGRPPKELDANKLENNHNNPVGCLGTQDNPVEPKEPVTDTVTDSVTDSVTDTEYTKEFETWWKLYPRKTGKGAAAKAFSKAKKKVAIKKLMAATEQQIQCWIADGKEHKYIPHPSTWLNQCRWDDEFDLPEEPEKSIVFIYQTPKGTMTSIELPNAQAVEDFKTKNQLTQEYTGASWKAPSKE